MSAHSTTSKSWEEIISTCCDCGPGLCPAQGPFFLSETEVSVARICAACLETTSFDAALRDNLKHITARGVAQPHRKDKQFSVLIYPRCSCCPIPRKPHGNRSGHRLVRLQGRAGQHSPLGTQRGRRICRRFFIAGGDTNKADHSISSQAA